jgi:hypothetical protein
VILAQCCHIAADEQKVQKAVDRGVAYLKQASFKREYNEVGQAALVGLALWECGVPRTDPAMIRVLDTVRTGGVALTHTYSISLAIMFLDRIGDTNDVPLIQSMGVRLLGGQNLSGGWTYECPKVEDDEVRRLTEMRQHELRAQPKPSAIPSERPKLPKQIGQIQARLEQQRALVQAPNALQAEDNSNTQFAILGLWTARRYGVSVEKALALVEQKFRLTQHADGGWSYSSGTGSAPAMTCAGLLGLATAYGIANEALLHTARPKNARNETKPHSVFNPGRDAAVISGLNHLSLAIGIPMGDKGLPVLGVPQEGRLYYFLWSLERVAVAYDLKTIGKKDWCAWGSDVLLATQEEAGSWTGAHGGAVDTSFALLFLRRSNLANDLTASLKGKVKDPGEVTLKAGGVGGEALRNQTKPAVADTDETPRSSVTPNAVPPAPAPKEATPADLSAELINAAPDAQPEILARYQNAKGVAYTEALASAIPRLPASSQGKARDALAERFMRMNLATLRARLRDNDAELRIAAARACAGKDDTVYVPDLIALLDDREPAVIRAARSALKHLSRGKDFGPADETNPADRTKAMDEWKRWWKSRAVK